MLYQYCSFLTSHPLLINIEAQLCRRLCSMISGLLNELVAFLNNFLLIIYSFWIYRKHVSALSNKSNTRFPAAVFVSSAALTVLTRTTVCFMLIAFSTKYLLME